MTAQLIKSVADAFSNASSFNKFFTGDDSKKIRNEWEPREQPVPGIPRESCKTNLFFGFFFDGTKNNYVQAETTKSQSNVARLYDCFPGLSVPGVLPRSTDWKYNAPRYTHFFKVYVPGVASPFKEVNDSGEGKEQTAGAAFGYKGEARVIWGLIQAINNVHRYFLKQPLLSPKETMALMDSIILNQDRLRLMKPSPRRPFQAKVPNEEVLETTRLEFEKILKRLHAAIAIHMPGKDGKPKKTDPAAVQKIFISTFGFSRGATQARAFTNWLMGLCALDARLCGKEGATTLGGFAVEFSFLGLFDTVASVGFGNTLGNTLFGKLFDGHGVWSDAESSLRIPPGLRCVHLVAAHEIRRSFPLDSISVKQMLPANSEEIVVPGVHSDLGCGYAPGEQGRGLDEDGADMLARVPLIYMYRQARLAGVPLKLELANEDAQERFKLMPETIRALNAYLATCQVKSGTLTAIMREQGKKQILWHKARRHSGKNPIESTKSFARASNFDKNDLQSANQEFEQEITSFESWLAQKGKGFAPTSQEPGFDNDHENEWEEIATWWNREPAPGPEVLDFFDNYVHDSRAWFKLIPGNPDNEADSITKLSTWNKRRKQIQDYNAREEKLAADRQKMVGLAYGKNSGVGMQPYRPVKDGLSDEERRAAEEFERTGKIPRMRTVGREPFDSGKAGYLRYRKVYGGYDSVLISTTDKGADEIPVA